MENTENYKILFDCSIKTEKKLREIYLFFLEKFCHNEKASSFWKSVIDNKEYKVNKLEKLFKSLDIKQLNQTADNIIILKTKNNLGNVNAVNLKVEVTLHDAVMIAYELEHSEINEVLKFLLKKFEPSPKQFELSIKQHEKYLDGLKKWYDKFTFDELYNI